MRPVATILMLFAVFMTLLGPLCLTPAHADGLEGHSIMTLDVCNIGQGDGVAAGFAVFILNNNAQFISSMSDAFYISADRPSACLGFTSGPDRPPRV
jgi:hypothetical protein